MPESPDNNILLFTYGSLRRGKNAHVLLKDATFIKRDEIQAKRIDTGSWFPGIIEGDGIVQGEVYEVSPNLLQGIDRYEGVDFGLYERRYVTTKSGLSVYVYFYTNKRAL